MAASADQEGVEDLVSVTSDALEILRRSGQLREASAKLLLEGLAAWEREQRRPEALPHDGQEAPAAASPWQEEGKLPTAFWKSLPMTKPEVVRLVCKAWAREMPRSQSHATVRLDRAGCGEVAGRVATLWPTLTSLTLDGPWYQGTRVDAAEAMGAVCHQKLETLRVSSSRKMRGALLDTVWTVGSLTDLSLTWADSLGDGESSLLHPLTSLTGLKCLELGWTGFEMLPLSLPDLAALTELRLVNVNYDGKQLQEQQRGQLPALPLLERLRLPEGLQLLPLGFSQLRNLRGLETGQMPELSALAELPHLEELTVTMTDEGRQGLQWLSKLPPLRRLTLSAPEVPISDWVVTAVAACTALRRLTLDMPMGDNSDGSQLRALGGLTELEELRLPDGHDLLRLGWLPAGLTSLAAEDVSATLEHLVISVQGHSSLIQLPSSLRHLRVTSLSLHGMLEVNLFRALSFCVPDLETLDITTQAPLHAKVVGNCLCRKRNLRTLALRCAAGVGDGHELRARLVRQGCNVLINEQWY